MLFCDKEFSKQLETAEARVNVDFIETRARLAPEHGAAWIEIGGTYAMFDGAESPLTQTFGLGLFEDATDLELEQLEKFFTDRGAPVFHEVSPMTDPSLMQLLGDRGYRPIELTSVMFRELTDRDMIEAAKTPGLSTRIIEKDEINMWARTSAAGWSADIAELGEFMLDFSAIGAACSGAFPFLAELDGKPISTGMLFIYDGTAVLAGASTIPEGRNRGAQTALLDARLRFAAEKGCEIAIMGGSPGSQSQKNAQKNGFNIAYTRTKWQLTDIGSTVTT